MKRIDIRNALTVCNVALDSVVSDIFGKSSTSIIDILLEQSGNSINHEEIASKLLKSLKSKEDAVIVPIEGYQMTDSQKHLMRLVRAHLDYITVEINDADSEFESILSSDPDYENVVQCAHAAVKSEKSPYYKKKYESLTKRRGKKRAIVAIARMILTAIFQMLSTGEVWNPSDLYEIDMPEVLVEKQKAKAIKQAMKLIEREGLYPTPQESITS